MSRALAVVLLVASVAAAQPAEPPPLDALRPALAKVKARRAALDRLAGPHAPFDLTYLPRRPADIQAIVALRPNVVFGHPDLVPTADAFESVAGHVLRMVGGKGVGPGFAALDQLFLCGYMTVAPNPTATDGKTAAFQVGGSSFVARTARPYDWDAAVTAWFPATTVHTHRGFKYRTAALNLAAFGPGLPPDGTCGAFFAAPDGRTLVADDVASVVALIDRLAEGHAVVPPPAWDRVDTAAIALALDNRNKQWVRNLPPPAGPVVCPQPADRLFLAADHFAVGLDLGPTTRFRAVAVCRNQFLAKHARASRREMLACLSDRFAPMDDENPSAEWTEVGQLTDALLKDGTATPTPLGFEYVGAAPGDLFGLIARMSGGAAPAPAVAAGR